MSRSEWAAVSARAVLLDLIERSAEQLARDDTNGLRRTAEDLRALATSIPTLRLLTEVFARFMEQAAAGDIAALWDLVLAVRIDQDPIEPDDESNLRTVTPFSRRPPETLNDDQELATPPGSWRQLPHSRVEREDLASGPENSRTRGDSREDRWPRPGSWRQRRPEPA